MILEGIGHQIITLLVGLIFGSVVAYARMASKQNKTMKVAVRTLLKAEINNEWRRLTERGYVFVHELEIVKDVYRQYEILGGNSGIDLLIYDIEKLDRVSSKYRN